MIRRRHFLQSAACSIPAALQGTDVANAIAAANKPEAQEAADLIVVGGGLGGCAAALAAARNGKRVVLTESTDWIGGQLTAQAVPPDEHKWIESFGATRAYRRLRQAIRELLSSKLPANRCRSS